MKKDVYLGVDVGSVSTNLVLVDNDNRVIEKLYLRTRGQPIKVVQEGLSMLKRYEGEVNVVGVGTTGSGRHLAGVIVGADTIKNEITAHAVASSTYVPDVQTVLEIGGQDSKIIIIRNGIVVDFAMNTVCAAGTGSFLDQQAGRLGIPIEDFGQIALSGTTPVRIAGRCTVFAESDMIHKQQMGHKTADIIRGLCEAMVRNYLNNVGKGKEILPTVVFQGGVAANIGMRAAFEEALGMEIVVPEHFDVMGAIGSAILAREQIKRSGAPTKFAGFRASDAEYEASSFECKDCPNLCEVISINMDGKLVARWGARCGKWDSVDAVSSAS